MLRKWGLAVVIFALPAYAVVKSVVVRRLAVFRVAFRVVRRSLEVRRLAERSRLEERSLETFPFPKVGHLVFP